MMFALTADLRELGLTFQKATYAMRQAVTGLDPELLVGIAPGSVGASYADRQAAKNYLSFFTNTVPLTLPGYGIDPNALTPGHGYDSEATAFYRALFTMLPFSVETAHGFGGAASPLGRRGGYPFYSVLGAFRSAARTRGRL